MLVLLSFAALLSMPSDKSTILHGTGAAVAAGQ
jgi:hypothetical protein